MERLADTPSTFSFPFISESKFLFSSTPNSRSQIQSAPSISHVAPPPTPPEWEFHQKYGIIHTWYCITCRNYIAHLDKFYGNQGPESPNSLYSVFYQDGVRDGVTVGKTHAGGLLHEAARLKIKGEVASERAEAAQKRCDELENQVRILTAQLQVHRPQSFGADRTHSRTANLTDPSARNVPATPPSNSVATRTLAHRNNSSTSMSTVGSHYSGHSHSIAQPSPSPNLSRRPSTSREEVQVQRPSVHRPGVPSFLNERSRTRSLVTNTIPEASSLPEAELPKTNPRLQDSVSIWFDYYCTHQKSWPRGVRCDSQRRPVMSDLRADRAIARFRPDINLQRIEPPTTVLASPQDNPNPNPSPRNQFKNLVVELFSEPGLYVEKVAQLGLRIASIVTYNPYMGPFNPITMEDVVHHLAKSGITRDMASEDFEPWAENYKAGVNCSIPFVPNPNPQTSKPRRRC